jgi:GT2 family glycosyltransferase
MISIIIITFGRKEEVLKCLGSIYSQDFNNFEVVFVDNNTDNNISEFLLNNTSNLKNFRYIKAPSNLGVAGGRNFAMGEAHGDIFVSVDDDAFFAANNSLRLIENKMNADRSIAVLAFKLLNYKSKNLEMKEFPFKNKKINPDEEREATYFCGGANALSKNALATTGFYPDNFFFGMEELDLSFRIIDNNYKIIYFPSVLLWHDPSSGGRMKKARFWQQTLENRLKVSMRNLPWRYFTINVLIWSLKVLKHSKNIEIVAGSYISLFRERKEILKNRKVIKPETIARLKKLDHRLYY